MGVAMQNTGSGQGEVPLSSCFSSFLSLIPTFPSPCTYPSGMLTSRTHTCEFTVHQISPPSAFLCKNVYPSVLSGQVLMNPSSIALPQAADSPQRFYLTEGPDRRSRRDPDIHHHRVEPESDSNSTQMVLERVSQCGQLTSLPPQIEVF